MRALRVSALLAIVFMLPPAGASAERPPAAASATGRAEHPSAAGLAALVPLPGDAMKRLKSGDPAKIQTALEDVRVSGRAGAAAVPAIADDLRTGLSPSLTKLALEALGDTENDGASEIAAWYARHRDPDIRRAAVETLAKMHSPIAVKALRGTLADADEDVRGLSAAALGGLKAKDAIDDLFAALERKVPEAAAAIGQLCSADECERLAGKLGSLPFDVVTSGLDEVLLRPAPEVKDDLKIGIVGRVREMGTAEANHFLKSIQTRWPTRASRRVKQAIDQAVFATANSPGADGAESSR